MGLRKDYELACPKCGQDDRLHIGCRTCAVVTENGVEDHDGMEWSPEDPCRCPECDYSGMVLEFDASNEFPYTVVLRRPDKWQSDEPRDEVMIEHVWSDAPAQGNILLALVREWRLQEVLGKDERVGGFTIYAVFRGHLDDVFVGKHNVAEVQAVQGDGSASAVSVGDTCA